MAARVFAVSIVCLALEGCSGCQHESPSVEGGVAFSSAATVVDGSLDASLDRGPRDADVADALSYVSTDAGACPPGDGADANGAALTKQGVAALKAHDYPRAIALLCQAVSSSPADSEARGELGWAQLQVGDLDRAELTTRRALADASNKGPLEFNLGHIRQAKGDLRGASQSYYSSFISAPSTAALRDLRAVNPGLADVVDPFVLHGTTPYEKVAEICEDDAGTTTGCQVEPAELAPPGTSPFRHVRLLDFSLRSPKTDPAHESCTRKQLLLETDEGKFASDPLGTAGDCDDINGYSDDALKLDIVRVLTGADGGAAAHDLVVDFTQTTEMEMRGVYHSDSFFTLCRVAGGKVYCTSPFNHASTSFGAKPTFDVDFALAGDGTLTFRTSDPKSELPGAVRFLLGTHELHLEVP